MDYRELAFYGQSEFASFADGSDASADERMIKSYLDPSLVASRRRVVRRPLGSGYQAQTIVFSERERDGSPSLTGSEPLSELLQQLAASRKSMLESGMPSARPARASSGGAGGASASVLSSLGLMGTEGTERRRLGGDLNSSCAGVNPTEQLRAHFVQECMLSALSYSGDPDEQSGGDPQ